MIILDTPEQIDMATFLARRSALKLECLGMKRGGRTAKEAICEALDNLREAQDEYQKVLTLLRETNKIEL